ncbi:unnamed protein product, partial [marine sediment metagenome]
SAWIQQAKLLASDGELVDYFGLSVSIDGDYAIIGAFHDDDNGDWSGSAYMFTRSGSTWTEQSKLTASDGAMFDEFGCSVSIDGDYAVVGANFDNDNGNNSGSAYIFKNNNPPNKPTIDGPTSGKKGETYSYDFQTTDPDGDDIYYWVDWGDESNTGWLGPYESGEEITKSHSWSKGTYDIKCKAKDTYDEESDWGTLQVEMPITRDIDNLFLDWLLDRFIWKFPIIRYILQACQFIS